LNVRAKANDVSANARQKLGRLRVALFGCGNALLKPLNLANRVDVRSVDPKGAGDHGDANRDPGRPLARPLKRRRDLAAVVLKVWRRWWWHNWHLFPSGVCNGGPCGILILKATKGIYEILFGRT
jgi:hypothetical protein